MKICDWCSEEFQPNVSYQIYCSPECRDSSTKEKVSAKYRAKKRKKLSQKERRCSNGCGTILSVYNESGICGGCQVDNKMVSRTLKELKGLIEYEKFDK
jgi:hypothetical protein